MDKKTLREIEDAIFDLESEARKNSTKALQDNRNDIYMYWRGKRSALSDVLIKLGEMIKE